MGTRDLGAAKDGVSNVNPPWTGALAKLDVHEYGLNTHSTHMAP
jgi:hypothetical protein